MVLDERLVRGKLQEKKANAKKKFVKDMLPKLTSNNLPIVPSDSDIRTSLLKNERTFPFAGESYFHPHVF